MKRTTITTAAFAMLVLAGCSSSSHHTAKSGTSTDTTVPTVTTSAATHSAAQARKMASIDCRKLDGTPVPASLKDVDCGGDNSVSSNSSTKYPCGSVAFYWISAQVGDNNDAYLYYGLPGKTWRKASSSMTITQMAAALGCPTT